MPPSSHVEFGRDKKSPRSGGRHDMPSKIGQSTSVGCAALKNTRVRGFILGCKRHHVTMSSLPPCRVGPRDIQVSAFGLVVLRPVRVADGGSWDALDERTAQREVEQPPDEF